MRVFPRMQYFVSNVLIRICILFFMTLEAQNITQAATDPNEVRALNSLFHKWGITVTNNVWNISGQPCSGAAIDSTSFDKEDYNPAIKCDCSNNNSSTCHIVMLKVYAMNVVGNFPEELWSLTSLINLNLGLNHLTGSIPAKISNLTSMQFLSLNANAFSGELPNELGKLNALKVLSFAENNFSGPLPSTLGNLSKLEQLYFSSSGVSGQIPATFAKLKSLTVLWASDTNLTGTIPDFIGLFNLTELKLQGNSFEGPIPSSFSKLSSLRDLRISDLTSGNSTLDFLGGMKSLSILVLRNNNISDSIPASIGGNQYLLSLDLSFNNLRGEIPAFLFNMSSLSNLFLGNNGLTGGLPPYKSSALRNIDVSYNNLSGSFPSWVSEENLQLNLVANYFTIQDSGSSLTEKLNEIEIQGPYKLYLYYGDLFDFNPRGLTSGLNCLQKNFPCNRGAAIYSGFAINCGGPQIKSSSSMEFEGDENPLGPASYFVADTSRWAVSNVGSFMDANSPQYISSTSTEIKNTLDTELMQTERISASSLRYYGLGLENGNYTVELFFVETAFLDPPSWTSMGRRVFDIYIQGDLRVKDFDIRKEANGILFQAVRKQFVAKVSENYLEIHLFWAGKGTCCMPTRGTYGPSVSAIRTTPEFVPTINRRKPQKRRNTIVIIVSTVLPVTITCLSVLVVIYILRKRRNILLLNDIKHEELINTDATPQSYTYAELKIATEDFSPSNKLGQGGFGTVYKGILGDGTVVAIKKLSATSDQGRDQFAAEIATISAVQHRNLVRLYGCCIEGDERVLVYEYLMNTSLDQALYGQRKLDLNWPTRFNICLGVAKGLAYLHEDSSIRIVHRDVKASNILLDSDLNPKISDFGLARLYDRLMSHINTRVMGTFGYLAPEYAMLGRLTEKADVFSFGVLALEIVTGRPHHNCSLDEDQIYILQWAWNLRESDREMELVDSRLNDEFNWEEVKRLIAVALLCTQQSPFLRPSMSNVVRMLMGDIEVSPVTSRPAYLADWKYEDVASFISNSLTTSAAINLDYTSMHDTEPRPDGIIKERP